MAPILHRAGLAAAALALSFSSICAPAVAAPSGSMVVALSALGDLSSFRAIAQDTLALVDKGDIAAARLRIKQLESTWDKAEAGLRSKDPKTWAAIDSMIDASLANLRTPSPNAQECAGSLKALIVEMNAVGRA